jgi:hypothetical protein
MYRTTTISVPPGKKKVQRERKKRKKGKFVQRLKMTSDRQTAFRSSSITVQRLIDVVKKTNCSGKERLHLGSGW